MTWTTKTSTDSEIIYHKSLKEICKKYGHRYTKELQAKNVGKTDRELCSNVVKDLELNITVDQLQRELEDILRRSLPHAPLQRGVERLLTHLHETGIPIALATNSTGRAVRLHATAKPKIFGMFHHMVCATDKDVDRGKPHPDIYLVAASRFPDKPKSAKCLVFEDSKVGLEAGFAAGMQVVFIPVARLPPECTKKATVVLRSMLDFKPEQFGLPPFDKPLSFPSEVYNQKKRN